jgi:hypothetical protein
MSKVESADLILKLYDLRREEKMRQAREWIFTFDPKNVDDFWATMMDPQVGPYLRMVTSYWEMAASFVNQGVIDAEMFNDITGEHIMVFAKVEPFLAEIRERFQNPKAFAHLEKAILDQPDGAERLAKTQEFLKVILAQIAQQQAAAAAQ